MENKWFSVLAIAGAIDEDRSSSSKILEVFNLLKFQIGCRHIDKV